jgi:hypothetical protein
MTWGGGRRIAPAPNTYAGLRTVTAATATAKSVRIALLLKPQSFLVARFKNKSKDLVAPLNCLLGSFVLLALNRPCYLNLAA